MKYLALTVPGEEQSLAAELWMLFLDTFFNSSTVYENINVDTSDVAYIRLIIIGLFVGLAVASFAATFNKRVLGGFVRKLLSEEALSPEKAKTLEELGFADNLVIYSAVKRSTNLRRVVKCREEQQYNEKMQAALEEYEQARKEDKNAERVKDIPYSVNAMTDTFYIPEDMKYMAEVKFEGKGNGWVSAILSCVLMLVLMLALLMALPYALEFLNNLAA